jgi:hypothetical protein
LITGGVRGLANAIGAASPRPARRCILNGRGREKLEEAVKAA